MKPHTLVWGTTAAAYFVGTTLAHLAFSLWLVAPRTVNWQGQSFQYSYRDAMPWLLPVVAVAVLAWLVREALRHGTRQRIALVAGYWLLWAGCVAGVDRWLTYSVPEYFHYPQYALLAWLLAKTLDPDRSRWPVGRLLLLTTLLGATDELVQYLWITASYSQYFDFNDVLVNLLAAVLGVMLYYGFRSPPPCVTRHRQPVASALAWVLCGLLLIVPVAATERVQLTPSHTIPPGGLAQAPDGRLHLYLQRQPGMYDRWHPGAWRTRHWVLGPLAATTALALVWLAWWPFGRLARVTVGRARRYDAAGRTLDAAAAPEIPQ